MSASTTTPWAIVLVPPNTCATPPTGSTRPRAATCIASRSCIRCCGASPPCPCRHCQPPCRLPAASCLLQRPEGERRHVLHEDPVARNRRLRPGFGVRDLVATQRLEGGGAGAQHDQLAVGLEAEEEIARSGDG